MFGASAAVSEVDLRSLLAFCTQIFQKIEYFFMILIFEAEVLEIYSNDFFKTFIIGGPNTEHRSVEI